jgi:hypothetical protein
MFNDWETYRKVLLFKCRPLPDMQLLSKAGNICKEKHASLFVLVLRGFKKFYNFETYSSSSNDYVY